MMFHYIYPRIKVAIGRARDWISLINFGMIALLFTKSFGYGIIEISLLVVGLLAITLLDMKYLMYKEVGYASTKNPIIMELLHNSRVLMNKNES